MYPLFFIAKHNLKKRKGDTAVLVFLTALAVLLLYGSISVLSGTKGILQSAYERMHGADIFYLTKTGTEEQLEPYFLAQPEVTEYESSPCLYFTDCAYRTDTSLENVFAFLLNRMDEEHKIGTLSGIEIQNQASDSILLPYCLKNSYQVGEHFFMTLGDTEYEFTVSGFAEDTIFATALNIPIYNVYITGEQYEKIVKEQSALKEASYRQYRMRIRDVDRSQEVAERIFMGLEQEVPELSVTMNIGVSWETMKDGVAIMSNIIMSVILLFSLLLIMVALIILWFSLQNFMEQNLKNIGLQQAVGYTAKQMQRISVLEAGLLAFGGILAGLLAGALASRFLGRLQGMLLGFRWEEGFQLQAACLTAGVVFLCITLTAGLTGRRYRKVTVLDALRGGIHTHNFRRNYFPLDKTRLPFCLALSGKQILGEKVKNLSIFGITVILAFTTCGSFLVFRNFAWDSEIFLKMVGMEYGDGNVTGENLEELGRELKKWPQIQEVLYWNSIQLLITNDGKECSLTCDVWKDPSLVENEMLVEGRLPEYDNEIVLTTLVAQKLGATVGDAVYVEGQGTRLCYLVCGIDQKINNMGQKAMLCTKGAVRLQQASEETAFLGQGSEGNTPFSYAGLYLRFQEGITFAAMEERLKEAFPNAVFSDSRKISEKTLSSVIAGVTAICAVFVTVTLFVVVLVEVLLIHARIIKERKNYGISKALGYTSGQLMRQTMTMNLPVILSGSLLGSVLGLILVSPLTVLCFSYCGIERCDLKTDPFFLVLTVAMIGITAVLASLWASLRIRAIDPVKLLTEE